MHMVLMTVNKINIDALFACILFNVFKYLYFIGVIYKGKPVLCSPNTM